MSINTLRKGDDDDDDDDNNNIMGVLQDGMCTVGSCRSDIQRVPTREERQTGINYRDPTVQKGARAQIIFLMFLSFSLVLLYVDFIH